MKRFLAGERSRAGILIVAASLIGGTGCVTSAVVSHVQAQQNLHDWQARQELENTNLRAAGRLGDSSAMTRLGWYQLTGTHRGIPADAKAGMALLEQAAARPFAPAQYRLGNLLVEGEYGVAPDPARGLELIKRAATGACVVGFSKEEIFGYPAWRAGMLLRDGGRYVTRDSSEAELWIARSVMHCHYPEVYGLAVPAAGLGAEQRALKQLALAQLAGRTTLPGQPAVSPEQMQEAAREARRLRQRVLDSETRYPAPPAP
jgi:TPR repeat protein